MFDLAPVTQPSLWKKRLSQASPLLNLADKQGLSPTHYFVDFWNYWLAAKELQDMNLGLKPRRKVGDPLQEAVPIYDTVQRRYAGFSNVLEQLWYGDKAPKFKVNEANGRATHYAFNANDKQWLYICLVHRCTGSGASFQEDHGWRNTIVPPMVGMSLPQMSAYVANHPGPSCTSIGNQPPPVRKVKNLNGARNSLQYYLAYRGPHLIDRLPQILKKQKTAMSVQDAVAAVLEINTGLGQKQFKFVLTAFIMDIAEYFPLYVSPASDCFHGSNARRAVKLMFGSDSSSTCDKAARLVADYTKTYPMDVEDVFCDFIRWVTNYLPKNFAHREGSLYNNSCLKVPDLYG